MICCHSNSGLRDASRDQLNFLTMLNFPIPTPLDPKEAARIERRRKFEEERRSRIFNARDRQIGIDTRVLEEQIAQRKAREAAERAKALAYEQKVIQDSKLALIIEKNLQEERRRELKELNEFRAACQRPEDSVTYDLNCPDRLKKLSLPDDSNCGPSSAKLFGGEDAASAERRELQRKQLKAWLDQQIREKEAAEAERRKEEQAHEMAAMAYDQAAVELSKAEQECRKLQEEALVEFNKALMVEKEACQREKERLELLDKRADIINCITGDFLSENPEVATSAFGPHRLVCDRWKGMSPEQREQIYKQQQQQAAEEKMRREEEKRRNAEWERYLRDLDHSAILMEKELMKRRREENEEILRQNKMLSDEQKQRKHHLNKHVYTNSPSAEYYEQFNTSTR
ncbi:RIB43A-like with coiled-coils protein 1 [Ischnura elegans]|uniref:RIB43A-like with coiled-coils protein 1 n=1 Tax=Ischnura elegans TaxID=197161 RepID=UPI001ED89C1E|nr:RIB43A-like with coiled-coils protein 1 [Ischnura elegans]